MKSCLGDDRLKSQIVMSRLYLARFEDADSPNLRELG